MATINVTRSDVATLADRLESRGTSKMNARMPSMAHDLILAARVLRVLVSASVNSSFEIDMPV
jgi:hypothetical protein